MARGPGGIVDARRTEGFLYLAAFGASIPLSNWMLGHVGVVCPASGPCLLPVGPGLLAPSGVLVVGLAFVLRDLVQRRLGKGWTLVAIALGAVLSAALAPPSLVLASGGAFAVSELADFVIYTPLQRRGLVLAVLVSSLVGLLVDSVLFLQLAFGSLDFLAGQVVGKAWMVMVSLPVVSWLRRRDERLGLEPA
jgi:queuosine precursor transporter